MAALADQTDLFEFHGPLATRETSRLAAESIADDAPTMRGKVLRAIVDRRSFGATDDELEVVLRMRHQTLSARRRELVLSGDIMPSGNHRKTRSGRKAVVWIAHG
jgi:hypothetical protein